MGTKDNGSSGEGRMEGGGHYGGGDDNDDGELGFTRTTVV